MGQISWAAFLSAALLVSLVPGANQLLSLRNAVRQGARDATIALVGRFTAFAVLVVLAAAGLGAVLVASATAFALIKWAGVCYLAALGVTTLWRIWRDRAAHQSGPDPTGSAEPATRGRWWLVRQEFLVAITNPKALLLFVAFLPQFVPTGVATAPNLLLLGAAYIAVEAVSAVGYTLLGGRIGSTELSRNVQRRLDVVTGVSFVGLAGALAAENRP